MTDTGVGPTTDTRVPVTPERYEGFVTRVLILQGKSSMLHGINGRVTG